VGGSPFLHGLISIRWYSRVTVKLTLIKYKNGSFVMS
jgi:hypothetical protein